YRKSSTCRKTSSQASHSCQERCQGKTSHLRNHPQSCGWRYPLEDRQALQRRCAADQKAQQPQRRRPQTRLHPPHPHHLINHTIRYRATCKTRSYGKNALLSHFATLPPSPTRIEYVLGGRASATSWLTN